MSSPLTTFLEDIGFTPQPGAPDGRLLKFTRVGLPIVITILGIALMVIGKGKTSSVAAVLGLVFVGVAIMVWMLNWMFRMSVISNDERLVEEEARDFFVSHGHWPDEADRD